MASLSPQSKRGWSQIKGKWEVKKMICNYAKNCDSQYCSCRLEHTELSHPRHGDYTKPLLCVRYHRQVWCVPVVVKVFEDNGAGEIVI